VTSIGAQSIAFGQLGGVFNLPLVAELYAELPEVILNGCERRRGASHRARRVELAVRRPGTGMGQRNLPAQRALAGR
jgi:hypothetical protein